jgi:hypothetical protein
VAPRRGGGLYKLRIQLGRPALGLSLPAVIYPQLESAWFQPLVDTYEVKTWLQSLLSNSNLCRYASVSIDAAGTGKLFVDGDAVSLGSLVGGFRYHLGLDATFHHVVILQSTHQLWTAATILAVNTRLTGQSYHCICLTGQSYHCKSLRPHLGARGLVRLPRARRLQLAV